jgi:hypothetical protein
VDYQAFEQVLRETRDVLSMRICAYAPMPNNSTCCCGNSTMVNWRSSCNDRRSPMSGAGIGSRTEVVRDRVMITDWHRCKSFPVESDEHFCVVARNIERDAPFSSRKWKSRDGRVCGDVITARLKNGHCWRRGQSTYQRIGSSGSISPTTSRNWNYFAAACNEAGRSAGRNGRMKLRDD